MVLCQKHFVQLYKYGKILTTTPSASGQNRVCSACGKTDNIIYDPQSGTMLCRRHYDQLKIYGQILERTVYDRNEYKIVDDYAIIYLRNCKHEIVGETIVDKCDLESVIKYKWHLNTWGYADSSIDGKTVMMQKYLLNTNELVDHIDRNPLNNRRNNLRISNKSENSVNVGIRKSNTSGVTGVSWANSQQSWRSYINYCGKRIELGMRRDKEKAIQLRLKAEAKYYGNYAPQKHLFEKYGIEINEQ